MKRKLVSVLLVLALCMGLAIPAFAEEAEELPIPEETEILTSEEVYENEEVRDVIFSWEGADVNWEQVETEDGAKWVAYRMPTEVEDFSASETYGASTGADCGHNNWGVGQKQEPFDYTSNNGSTHTAYYLVGYICKTPGCLTVRYDVMERTESHSLSKTDYGSNYHKGTLHYVEWYCVCNKCGCQTTKWESQRCPGNDNGEGCIFGINKVEPPVEELNTAPVEEVTEPEETTEPEDVVIPEEVITPEVADIPEEVETPEETVEPEETEDLLTGEKEFAGTECEGWHLIAECEYEEALEGSEGVEIHTVKIEFWEPCDGLCQNPMVAEISPATTAQADWYCVCGSVNWDNGTVESVSVRNINDTMHEIEATVVYVCQSCRRKTRLFDSWKESHIWGAGTYNENTHTYKCSVDGCTGKKTESHSLSKNDFGSNYHKGTLHYVEWFYCCAACGYQESRWESQRCPGNDNGEGCIFGINKVEPPAEELNTAPVEEMDVTEPGDVATPEDVTEPEEPNAPEVTDIPEETEVPEGVEMPEETEVPEEPILPEDPTGSGETVVPEDGESVE